MTGRRCHCGCRALLERRNVRTHAVYASRSCKARTWKRQHAKASTSTARSQNRVVCESSLTTTPPYYTSALMPATLPLTGGESRAMDPSSSPNRLRDEVSAAPSCARESQNETINSRPVNPNRTPPDGLIVDEHGYVIAAPGNEPESFERQFVRWVYNGDEDEQMPYQPASLGPKRKPRNPATVPPINRVLRALSTVGCEWRTNARNVDEWLAQCPTHDDSRPSLVIRRNHDGSIWLKCWGGCSKEGILAALGLEWRDLWEASERDYDRAKPCVRPLLPAHLRRAMVDLLRLDDERRAA